MKVLPIQNYETKTWLLNRHYAKRIPSISFAFGLYDDNNLVGVCTFGSPPSPSLCTGVCGEQYKDKVLELNRLIVDSPKPNSASYLVSQSLKLLPKPSIVLVMLILLKVMLVIFTKLLTFYIQDCLHRESIGQSKV